REKVPTLRHVLVSSAPLSAALAREVETRTKLRLVQGWGLSEYTNFACCDDPFLPDDEHEQRMYGEEVPSIGGMLPGPQGRVCGPEGASAAEGVRGELAVRGHSRMLGYFQDAGATAKTIDSDGWLRTGDEGFFRLREDKPIFFVTGRIKEIIIRDAEKFSPLR